MRYDFIVELRIEYFRQILDNNILLNSTTYFSSSLKYQIKAMLTISTFPKKIMIIFIVFISLFSIVLLPLLRYVLILIIRKGFNIFNEKVMQLI